MPRVDEAPDIPKLRTPQLRVLAALRDGAILSRTRINQAAGFSEGSGTLNYALNGMKVSKANPRPHPGLMELGLVEKLLLDIDGLEEQCYRITGLGLAVLVTDGRELGALRSKEVSTNKRYKEE